MTALTTQARSLLSTQLATTSYVVHDVAPPTPVPTCLVIVPDDPWVQLDRIGSPLQYTVGLKVLVVADARTNAQGLLDSEDAVDAVLDAVAGNFQTVRVGPPQLTDIGAQGAVLTTEISLAVRMKE